MTKSELETLEDLTTKQQRSGSIMPGSRPNRTCTAGRSSSGSLLPITLAIPLRLQRRGRGLGAVAWVRKTHSRARPVGDVALKREAR